MLRVIVQRAKSHRIRDLFGFTDTETPLKYDLSQLKICFAHFGGDDEWEKYFEKDRDNIVMQIVKQPSKGIRFIGPEQTADEAYGNLELIWKSVDWYTIIRSMMLQHDNLFADISYILHNESTIPLLKFTLQNDKLKARVLFGTDFYVVRNHKSDKEMLAEIECNLSREEFDLITRINPRIFLRL